MGNSKVIFGDETLIDLTGDTVMPDTLLDGTTAHNRSGEQIVGTVTVPEELDDLTDVTITSAADGDLLQYNSTSGEWENSDTIPDELTATQENGAYNRAEYTFTSQTLAGLTFTENADKSISIAAGTATGAIDIHLNNALTLPAGTHKMVGVPAGLPSNDYLAFGSVRLHSDDGGSVSFTLNAETTAQFRLVIHNGSVISSNITIYPMIYDARLVNPPYQSFTMTNRELTDALDNGGISFFEMTGTMPDAQNLNVLQTIGIPGAYGTNYIYSVVSFFYHHTGGNWYQFPNQWVDGMAIVSGSNLRLKVTADDGGATSRAFKAIIARIPM